MNIPKIFLCAIIGVVCSISTQAQITENAPRPRADFPARKPPAMTMEEAIGTARKALEKQKTPIKGRFVSKAECIFDAKQFPHEAADFGKGPFWLIVLRDPEYAHEEYPIAPIRVLVFGDNRVAILAPE